MYVKSLSIYSLNVLVKPALKALSYPFCNWNGVDYKAGVVRLQNLKPCDLKEGHIRKTLDQNIS